MYSPKDIVRYTQYEYELLKQGLFKQRLKALNINLDDAYILDLAAGPGTWEIAFNNLFRPRKIIWHDISPDFLKIAQEHHRAYSNIEYRLLDLTSFPYPDSSFDFVFCRLALRHSNNELYTFCEVARTLKPNGYFYFETHNYKRIFKTYSWKNWKKIFALVSPIFYLLIRKKILPTPYQLEFFIKRCLKKANLEVLSWEYLQEMTIRCLCQNSKTQK